MANIIGSVFTSHVPAIGGAIAKGRTQEDYWKPFFDGFPPVHQWLKTARPDVLVVLYNDHGLNFFLDKMPTFSVGAAPHYTNADEGWGIPQVPTFTGDTALSWHLIESLVGEDFDLTTWYGVWAPKDTPDAVVNNLAGAMAEVSKDKAFLDKTASLGIVPTARGPKEFAAFIKQEVETNTALLKDAGFKPE